VYPEVFVIRSVQTTALANKNRVIMFDKVASLHVQYNIIYCL